MSGIVRRGNAGCDDAFVARPFLRYPDLSHGPPGERIKPIKSTNDLCDRLRKNVPAFDVDQLMQEDDPSPIVRPLFGIGRQYSVIRQLRTLREVCENRRVSTCSAPWAR